MKLTIFVLTIIGIMEVMKQLARVVIYKEYKK